MKKVYAAVLLVGMGMIALAPFAAVAQPTSLPATTQTTGRDTPAGAMTVYQHALAVGDVATVTDSFNYVPQLSEAIARELVAVVRLQKALDSRLGHDQSVAVCKECDIPLISIDDHLTDDLWTISPQTPNEAIGKGEPGQVRSKVEFMMRGPDGIWRLGRRSRRVRPTTDYSGDPMIKRPNEMTRRIGPVLAQVESGQLASADAVIAALYPEGSPQAKRRQQEQKEHDEEEKHAREAEAELLAAHFDQSTPMGTIGMIVQALHKHDPAAAARGYFVKDATGDRFALATARRYDAAFALMETAEKHATGNAESVAMEFNLFDRAQFAFLSPFTRIQEHGDTAVIASDGHDETAIWFFRKDGQWKQQLEPPAGESLDEAAEDLELDAAAIAKVTAAAEQGKYPNDAALRDALGAAELNSFEDWSFTQDFLNYDQHRGGKEHHAPEPPGSQSADPKTPAGAMNRFIRAVQAGDERTAASCFALANDHDGSAAAALAHDYIVGVKFLRAAVAKEPKEEAGHYLYHAFAILEPESLREYTDDEWKTLPDKPDLAVEAGSTVGKPEPGPGSPNAILLQHTWTPMLRRGGDGVWRIGTYYPQNARQLAAQVRRLTEKDRALQTAADGLIAGTLSRDDACQSVLAKLKQLGARPVASENR